MTAAAPHLESGRAAPAASLAALAESGLLFLPVWLLVVDEGGSSAGPLASYPAFVALFTGSVAAATAFRHSSAMPSAVAAGAVGVGLAQALVWGKGVGLAGTGVLVILALLMALRTVVLAHRDWRDPVAESFVVGTLVLLAEVVVGTSGEGSVWEAYLPAVAAQFFLGSLGSRAASVWLAGRIGAIPDRGSRPRLRSAVLILGGLAAVLLGAAVLAAPHGVLPRAGGFALFLLGQIVYGLAFVTSRTIAGPIAWLVERLDIDLSFVTEAARNLEGFLRRGRPRPTSGSSPLLRFLGVVVLAAVGFLLFRAIRRYRELAGVARVAGRTFEPESTTDRIDPRPGLRRRSAKGRRELPADRVRRWYAEALLATERLGLSRPPSRTPGEYLRTVTSAFPECAREFTALTSAYEGVRYGGETLPNSAIDRLDASRQRMMAALRRAKPIEEDDA
jgi:hypothetical protein